MPRQNHSRSRACLSPAQSAALRHAEAAGHRQEAAAHATLPGVFHRAGLAPSKYDEAIETITRHARIVLHFHPDRFGNKTTNVAESLLIDGIYRNQFETGLSTASPTAYPGGERDTWERTLFGGAYHAGDVLASERPKYGAMELVRFPDGPIPRFGSCYFVLRGVSSRTSFTFMGSEHPQAIDRIGTISRPHSVMVALLTEIEQGGFAAPPWPPYRAPTLGVPNLTVPRFLDLLQDLKLSRPDPSLDNPGRVLDTLVEAHVHGPVELEHDVEALVADPSFASSPVGRTLRELAAKYGFPLRWHRGFHLRVRDVPEEFRGPEVKRLAYRIAGPDGVLDAAAIGRAAASLRHQPGLWRDWGSYREALQRFRQLWHVLVHYGDTSLWPGPVFRH